MWIYYCLILFILILAAIIFYKNDSPKSKKIYLFIVFIPLFVLSAFRADSVGNDTSNYLQIFDILKDYNFAALFSTQYETGYVLFNKIIAMFTDNNQFLLIVAASFIIPSILRVIYKESVSVWLSIYLFIVFRYYYFTMSGVRQSLALATVLWSIEYIKKRRFIPFLLIVLLAASFHSSAILFLLAYFIPCFKFDFRNVMIVILVSVISFFSFNYVMKLVYIVLPQFQYYQDSAYFETEGKFGIVLMAGIALGILILGYITKYYKQVSTVKGRRFMEGNFYSFMMLLAFALAFVALNANIIQRAQMYYGLLCIIFIPNAIASVENKGQRAVLTLIVMVITLVSHITIYVFRPEWNLVAPYAFY